MSALNENALLIESGNIYIGDDENSAVDFGALRNLKFSGIQSAQDIKSDNRGTLVRNNRINGQVSFDWLEAGDANKLENMLKGIVTIEQIAGNLVAGAVQIIASPFVPGKFVKITNQNGDKSLLDVNSVTGSVDGALVANDDYILTQDDFGNYGIVLNTVAGGTTLTTLVQTVTINYDYTPNEGLKITGGESNLSTPRFVKIVALTPTEENPNATRTFILTEAVVDGDLEFPFLDVEEANDVGVMPVTFINNKGALWYFIDEKNT